jgi:protoporphyrinogen oxidase
VISAQGDHQQMSQDELAETCHRELAKAGLVSGSPAWSRVIAEKRATITCGVGMKKPEMLNGGVYLAGDYVDPDYPPTLEAAVRSGVRAASALARRLVEGLPHRG